MIRILAEENISRRVVIALRKDGRDVIWIAEATPGISDDLVLAEAVNTNRVLVTADRDFGEMVVRRKIKVAGVILLALDRLRPEAEATRAASALAALGDKASGAFVVIEPARIRFRPLIV